jgi:hypothetical protein
MADESLRRWVQNLWGDDPIPEELMPQIVGVEIGRLREMLPSQGATMKPRPIRLCAACYAENPCHQIEWQFKDKLKCDRHNLGLLTKCTNCETPFPIPADWVSSGGVGRDDAAVSGAGVGFCICPKP